MTHRLWDLWFALIHLTICSWKRHRVNPAYPYSECSRCWAWKGANGKWR